MVKRHEPAILAGTGTLTLIDGLTFAISNASGDIGDGLDGLIADDTRHLSRLAVRVEGAPVRPLGATLLAPSSARFRGVVVPGRAIQMRPWRLTAAAGRGGRAGRRAGPVLVGRAAVPGARAR